MMTGRCLCGAVTFTAEHVELSGAELRRYTSSTWAERGFCARCGTTLFYFLEPMKAYTMSVGAFDDQSPFTLVREIFIDCKPDGYAFAGDHERWTEAETFERLAPP